MKSSKQQEAHGVQRYGTDARRNNIVIHNLPEPPNDITSTAMRKEKDRNALMDLMKDIEVNINMDKDIKFSVRPGKVSESSSEPRPLLVGFRSQAVRDNILDNARKLKHSDLFSRVSLVPDLTNQQRQEDKELQQEADRLNRDLEAEGNLNYQYRCTGRKGERILVKSKVTDTRSRQPATGANLLPLGNRRATDTNRESNNTVEEEEEVTMTEEEEEEEDTEMEGEEEELEEREDSTRTKRKATNSPTNHLSQESRKGKKKKKNMATP